MTKAKSPQPSKGTHNPSPSSLRRWENEGGGPRGNRPRDPAQLAKLPPSEKAPNVAPELSKGRRG
jgi:hypothetical protein